MNQLMMWKRNGKEEWGYEYNLNSNHLISYLPDGNFTYPKSSVTELQPAKPVPLDAGVISKGLWETIELCAKNHKDTIHQGLIYSDILAENPHLIKPEPMKEPTNFGAIVEASAKGDVPKQFWIKVNDFQWQPQHLGFSRRWDELINPVLKSEGVVGK